MRYGLLDGGGDGAVAGDRQHVDHQVEQREAQYDERHAGGGARAHAGGASALEGDRHGEQVEGVEQVSRFLQHVCLSSI